MAWSSFVAAMTSFTDRVPTHLPQPRARHHHSELRTDEVLRTGALAPAAHREIFSHLLMVPGGNFFMAWASLTCSSSVKIAFRLSSSNRAASASARCRARSAASSFRCRAWRPPTAHFQRMRIRQLVLRIAGWCQTSRAASLSRACHRSLSSVHAAASPPGPSAVSTCTFHTPCKSLSDFHAISVDDRDG